MISRAYYVIEETFTLKVDIFGALMHQLPNRTADGLTFTFRSFLVHFGNFINSTSRSTQFVTPRGIETQ